MNDQNWLDQIQWQEMEVPMENISGEEIYTLKSKDFLLMPEINFKELILIDPDLRALLN